MDFYLFLLIFFMFYMRRVGGGILLPSRRALFVVVREKAIILRLIDPTRQQPTWLASLQQRMSLRGGQPEQEAQCICVI